MLRARASGSPTGIAAPLAPSGNWGLPEHDSCKATLDNEFTGPHFGAVIGSIRHKGLRDYWTRGRSKGLNAAWIRKLRRILSALEAAERPEHMNYPGSYFHPLRGDMEGRYSVRLTANYRVTFGWDEDGAVDVDIEDYH